MRRRGCGAGHSSFAGSSRPHPGTAHHHPGHDGRRRCGWAPRKPQAAGGGLQKGRNARWPEVRSSILMSVSPRRASSIVHGGAGLELLEGEAPSFVHEQRAAAASTSRWRQQERASLHMRKWKVQGIHSRRRDNNALEGCVAGCSCHVASTCCTWYHNRRVSLAKPTVEQGKLRNSHKGK